MEVDWFLYDQNISLTLHGLIEGLIYSAFFNSLGTINTRHTETSLLISLYPMQALSMNMLIFAKCLVK